MWFIYLFIYLFLEETEVRLIKRKYIIRILREEKGITQQQLGEAIYNPDGKAPNAWQKLKKFENDLQSPSDEDIRMIAKELDVSINDISDHVAYPAEEDIVLDLPQKTKEYIFAGLNFVRLGDEHLSKPVFQAAIDAIIEHEKKKRGMLSDDSKKQKIENRKIANEDEPEGIGGNTQRKISHGGNH